MKGKIGLVVGLGAGYVLGTRAGRERYEQIKRQWLKVWDRDEVQQQVEKVKDFAKAQAAAVPGAVWDGAVKVAKSVGGAGTPREKLESAVATGKEAARDVARTAQEAAEEVKDGSTDTGSSAGGAGQAASTSGTKSSSAKKPSQNGS